MSLLTSRRFLPLFLTQFLGAFNDNIFKNALIILITYRLVLQEGESAAHLVTLAAGIFILPFFLFSATAGQLADRYDRGRVARIVKLVEILLAVVAGIGFSLQSLPLLFAVLFGFGLHSTFFGPVKYALLPQHLQAGELLQGNAYIEAATFLAILLGTIGGGELMLHGGTAILASALILCALGGYAASRLIPPAPAPASLQTTAIDWHLPRASMAVLRASSKEGLMPLILAISWFWLVGATFLSQFPGLVKNDLHGEGAVVTLLLTIFSVGIGIGSLLCNRLLKGRVKLGIVPWAQ